ncbi:MAG: hypothetical protein ACKOWD_00800 [Rhodoferax sp.]
MSTSLPIQPNAKKEVKERFMTLRMPLALQNQLKDLAEANTRTISGQALLYIKQGIAQDMQEKNGLVNQLTSTKS